ncbi:exo-beta-N-acetylmuramidase NamZ family protein [Desulfospira joergensenii]|uniref:exo-beta-N-acetylmuramidase NamZ family protein n=1 Tax=Desulfospira joergensenii TaxID=53329 RepID=UPI0003B3D053|nr:DUF1343 domain-containing protein [Desulfospira joergensenii]
MNPAVITGLENFRQNPPQELKNQRLGLLANPASVAGDFRHAVEIINESFPGQLSALFSPQHGFYAEKQDNMIESSHTIHPRLNIPVYSLYSDTRIPTPDMFQDIDTLIVDIQDVGTRVYTFIYTISFCMETAAGLGKKVMILDRPNPIGGIHVEGNLLEPEFASFVGRFPIPMRHGLTVGEISKFFSLEFNLGCDLSLIPMKGWTRKMLWQDTGLAWIPPSPNLPTPLSCSVYPGQVIFEGTNLSEGRGTTLPFEQFGAPFLDTGAIIQETWGRIKGAHLREVNFEPTSGKWQNRVCRGFHIHILDPDRYRPYFSSLLLLQAILKFHPDEFQFKEPPYEYEYDRMPMDLILGSQTLRQEIMEQKNLKDLEDNWCKGLNHFTSLSRKYHLYGG